MRALVAAPGRPGGIEPSSCRAHRVPSARDRGILDGRRVLVTGAAGGVGRFAVQLAGHGGARVTGVVGRAGRAEGLVDLGVHEVAVGMPEDGEFDPQIGLTAEWDDAAQAVDALMSRRVTGKAVLLID